MQIVFTRLILTAALLILGSSAGASENYQWQDVSGTGVHYFTTAIIHSQQPTATGIVQRSTDIIELRGDLNGTVLYHPVTRIDQVAGTLVNRGHQVFSGTVLGLGPVLLHDDEFRFEVNLATGETIGTVRLTDRIAGPITRCRLDVVGTGTTEQGDGMVNYTGRCKVLANTDPEADRW